MRAYLDDCATIAAENPTKTPPSLAWHVVKAATGDERAVAEALSQGGIRTFCPMQMVTRIDHGRLREARKALFQNYLFACWEKDDPHRWHQVMETIGVIEIIGGHDPKTVDDDTVQKWINRTDDDDILADESLVRTLADIRRGWREGDLVFCPGAYVGHRMLVLMIDETKQTVRLQLALLGRIVVIEQPVADCQYAGSTPDTATPDQSRRGARRGRRGGKQARLVRSFRKRRRRR